VCELGGKTRKEGGFSVVHTDQYSSGARLAIERTPSLFFKKYRKAMGINMVADGLTFLMHGQY
jgi:hypothetical protein